MNQDDLIIAKLVRRLIDKRDIDTMMTVITVEKGKVYIQGTIKPKRSTPNVDVKEEIEAFKSQIIKNIREVRGLFMEARIIEAPKKEHKEEHAPGAEAKVESNFGATKTGGNDGANEHHVPGRHL